VERARLLVVSAGGHPTDATLIQAHKALDAGCRFLVDGGEVLFVADLGQGLGSAEMTPFVEDPDPGRILARLASSWVQYGHTTLRLLEKTSRFRVHLHSRLDPELVRRLGMQPAADPGDVIERWRVEHPGETVLVMSGPPVYPAPAAGDTDR
jgi:nickel-dependent lactate racemase